MSITKCPGHMRSLKLSFSATVLTLGLKGKIFENKTLLKEHYHVFAHAQKLFRTGG